MEQHKAAQTEQVDQFEVLIEEAMTHPHPKALRPVTFLVIALTAVLGSIIGMELIVNLGVTPNTSIIGALIAVIIGFIPAKVFSEFRNIHTQNLVETGISASTFGAGNVMIYALSVVWLLNVKDAIPAMLAGAAVGMIIDISVLYILFDTPVFPAVGAWPLGVATSETILAAAEKGKKAILLVCGAVTGAIGSFFGIPMDIIGICVIGNLWALLMFCLGLILRGYVFPAMGISLDAYYIPHGMMLGAGLVALVQVAIIIHKNSKKKRSQKAEHRERAEHAGDRSSSELDGCTRSADDMKKGLVKGFLLFLAGAVLIAVMGGLFSKMPFWQLILWVVFAACAAIGTELIIGISAMHSGWFPGVATTLIFLVLGLFLGFPIPAMALLVGYTSSTGPAFADMGYDLKTGWILRGKGRNPAFELEGRKQQYTAELIGAGVAIVVSAVAFTGYFSRDLVPPASRVLVATIQAGIDPSIIKYMVVFALFGGFIQFIGGSNKQLGIMLSTGLLITNPKAGLFGLITLAVRYLIEKKRGEKAMGKVVVFGAGLIAGSAVYSFFNGTLGGILGKKK